MEKNKNLTKNEKYPLCRIPEVEKDKLKKFGDGNWRRGLTKVISIAELMERDPTRLLQEKLEEYIGTIKAFAPDNHYEHFIESGIPAMLHRFNKRGMIDSNLILNKRVEKPIDEFDKNKKEVEE